MDTRSRTISTEDGRDLRIIEAGLFDGIPILVHNGTPGARLLYPPCVKDAEARGIHLISYERPGYGASTPQPGRTIASAAYDVAAIAEALSLRRLAVWGISGGGPHALACAALLPNLVVTAAALASPAPYQAEGLDWFAGMNEGGVTEFRAALSGRQAMEQFVEAATPGLLNSTAATFAQAFGSVLNPPDAAALTEDLARYLLDCFYEGIHQRRDGWIDDDLAFVNEWGFELSQTQVPVMLMQGAQDDVVPLPHGQWLANAIPNVNAQFLPEDGHLTLLAHRIPDVHAWLIDKM
jgi:pimeloyl-ACP methyl ester carboxylesterase